MDGLAIAGAARAGRPASLARASGRALGAAEAAMLAQRGHLLPWAPVALGAGIAAYFALPVEPGPAAWAAVAALLVAALLAARALGPAWGPLALGVALAAGGAGLAGLRAHAVAAPVLSFRYHGPVEGRIVVVDRSASDALRLTLDRVVLEDVAPVETPERVRVSLQGDQRWLVPEPGRVVMMTAHLGPPSGPAEPGDFDFRRAAWFDRLGAVGFTDNPVLTRAAPEGGLWIGRLRTRLSEAVRARIPGDAGGLAAAVMTGDRSGLSAAANDAMRDSGLYHLVSISGMHMGMLVAFTFGLVRTLVAAVPPLALRVNGKKVAALAALPVAAFYLLLAGRDVATERAFVMAAVMLGAILLDRQAITLRTVAVAALIVLALRPEALLNPGFQMSFAAVVALSVAFSRPLAGTGRWRWAAPALMLVLSSLVAGLATAPYAGATFNRFQTYGLLANLLAVPAMGLLVMPGAALLAVGSLVGIVQPALLAVELGCEWILFVSRRVAAMDGAVGALVSPPAAMVPLFTVGALVVVLWQGRARWLGGMGVVAALWLWSGAARPALLVADTGGLVGVLGPGGRAMSRATGDGFAADAWLENDGDLAGREAATARDGFAGEPRLRRTEVAGLPVVVARGVRALAALDGCGGAAILVANEDAGPRPCLVLDPAVLRGTGAVAGWVEGGRLVLVTAAQAAGRRPWTGAGAPALAPLPLPAPAP